MPDELAVVVSPTLQVLQAQFEQFRESLRKYTMMEPDQKRYAQMYDFYVDEQLKTYLVHRYSTLGPQSIFIRNPESPRSVYSTCRERDFERNRGEWVYSPLLLEDRFKIKDPIVRDAFSPEVNLDKLVFNYKLVSAAPGRFHDVSVDEMMQRMGIYNGA